MQPHRQPGRLADRAIHRIERYRRSSVAQNNTCRFTPSCSHYAEDALRHRTLLVALWLITWRLMRCNPFMHRRVADPVQRSRRRLRPNTLPTMLSIIALSGFVVVVTAGIAEAVGVSGGCQAQLNGKPVARYDIDHALVVKKHGSVQFVGSVPPEVENAPKGSLTSNTHIDVDIINGIGGVSSSNHPGRGPFWGGTEAVDKYLKYGVGLYHVEGKATGEPGGWSCVGDAYVELKDGNPLGKPVGGGAAGLTFASLLGAYAASRGGQPAADNPYYMGDDEATRDDEDRASDYLEADGPYEFIAGFGCLILLVIAIGASFLARDIGVGAAAVAGRTGIGGRVWSHGHPILGFVSGLFLGIGATVLLQQFAVWPLTIVTAIVFPVVVAVICSLRAWLGRPYKPRAA